MKRNRVSHSMNNLVKTPMNTQNAPIQEVALETQNSNGFLVIY